MSTMQMQIKKDALEKIRDYNRVNYIRTAKNSRNRFFLIAGLVGGDWVQITEDESILTYSFEAAQSISAQLGVFYSENFVMLNNDNLLNWRNLKDLSVDTGVANAVAVVSASFNDGTESILYGIHKEKKVTEEMRRVQSVMAQVQSLQEAEKQSNISEM